MEQWYRNELTVTTDDDLIGLQSFFWFYFPDEDYILIDQPINTFCMVRRTPDNFLKRIDAFFYTWGQAAKSGDIDHLNPVESDHLLSGAN